MAIVYLRDVARILGVDRTTCLRWTAQGHLAACHPGVYRSSDLDAFLAVHARGFAAQPRWEDLASGRIKLCSHSVMALRFNIGIHKVKWLCVKWRVPGIKLPGHSGCARVSLSDFEEKWQSFEPSVGVQLALRAIGYAMDAQNLRHIPALVKTTSPLSSRQERMFVTLESLNAYLRDHLPPWIDPYDWLDDCRSFSGPLLTRQETQVMLGVPSAPSGQWFYDRRALFVMRPVSFGHMSPRISPLWVHSQLEQDVPLSNVRVARIFGVHPNVAGQWILKGQFVCPIDQHKHIEGELHFWRSCWLAYLYQNCTPSIRPGMARFLSSRLDSDRPPALYLQKDVAEMYGYHPTSVMHWVRSGRLPGIRTPGGQMKFTRSWVRSAGLPRRS